MFSFLFANGHWWRDSSPDASGRSGYTDASQIFELLCNDSEPLLGQIVAGLHHYFSPSRFSPELSELTKLIPQFDTQQLCRKAAVLVRSSAIGPELLLFFFWLQGEPPQHEIFLPLLPTLWLSVSPSPPGVPGKPQISGFENPVTEGGEVTLTCTSTGSKPPAKLHWYRGDQELEGERLSECVLTLWGCVCECVCVLWGQKKCNWRVCCCTTGL